jgi:hypothetical protein
MSNGLVDTNNADYDDYMAIRALRTEYLTVGIYAGPHTQTAPINLELLDTDCNVMATIHDALDEPQEVKIQIETSGVYYTRVYFAQQNPGTAQEDYVVYFGLEPNDDHQRLDAGNMRSTALNVMQTVTDLATSTIFEGGSTGSRIVSSPQGWTPVLAMDNDDWYKVSVLAGQTTITLTPDCDGAAPGTKVALEVKVPAIVSDPTGEIGPLEEQTFAPDAFSCAVQTTQPFLTGDQEILIHANLKNGVGAAGYTVQVSTEPENSVYSTANEAQEQAGEQVDETWDSLQPPLPTVTPYDFVAAVLTVEADKLVITAPDGSTMSVEVTAHTPLECCEDRPIPRVRVDEPYIAFVGLDGSIWYVSPYDSCTAVDDPWDVITVTGSLLGAPINGTWTIKSTSSANPLGTPTEVQPGGVRLEVGGKAFNNVDPSHEIRACPPEGAVLKNANGHALSTWNWHQQDPSWCESNGYPGYYCNSYAWSAPNEYAPSETSITSPVESPAYARLLPPGSRLIPWETMDTILNEVPPGVWTQIPAFIRQKIPHVGVQEQ